MEATVLSVGKSALNGALSSTKSAISEEVALQLGVQRDQAFIREELEMMKSFLMVAHEERDEHKLLSTWVKQVRDVAYDAEDCLQDFTVHLEKPSWWRLPCTLQERRRIAKQMKELRTRVEDISQRNLRYHLIKDSTSNHATKSDQAGMIAEAIFDVNEARWAAMNDHSKVDLVQLINNESKDLRVIAIWGTSGDLGQMSIIRVAYEDPAIERKFLHRAWVRVMHPFNPIEFVHSMVEQFRSTVGVEALLGTERTGQELAEEFNGYVNEKEYLIVLNGLSSIEDWDRIKTCFPDKKNGSRIIVSTPHVEVASLCMGQESLVSELKQLYYDHTLYAFYNKDSQDGTELAKPMPTKNLATSSNSMVSNVVIPANQSKGVDVNKAVKKNLTRIRTAFSLEESQLIGREKEKSDIIALITNLPGQELPVISVWGMGGLGKTILVKDVYQSKNLRGMFDKRAFVTVMRPFSPEEVLKSLAMQLDAESSEKKAMVHFRGHRRKTLAIMGIDALKELARILERKMCLIVLDDLSSRAEWDMIIPNLPKMENTSRIIVTTREENIALHCSNKQENIYSLTLLQDKDALDLLTRKIHDKSEDEIAGNYFMELIDRNMMLPSQQSVYSRKGIDSCHVHDLMCGICISKATEENLVFRLEEGCSSDTQGIFRHLVIRSNWRGDESDFESIIDLSRVRSLTVFGKVRSFFISEKMRLLRVLDLEGTEGLLDHHLQQIGKLYHLKYLSLRRCDDIYYLPDSWGNLRQLQTLDIAFTNIQKLPKTITRLTKLRFLRAGSVGRNAIERYKEMAEDLPKTIASNRLCLLTLCSVACCMAWCAPQLLKSSFSFDGEPNRHDVCTGFCCSFIPSLATQQTIRGVQVPRGIQKLKSLQTMGLVNLAHGTSILKDIKLLTQLRKLAVTGVSWKNGPHLCAAIVNLRCLESLLLQSDGYVGFTGWLNEMPLPPLENLRSLKLYGIIFQLPKWIERLQNLVKLSLWGSRILDVAATIEALGKLPNLTILRLMFLSFRGEELHFNFRGEAFLSLMVMEFYRPYRLESVKFQEGAMPKLEFLDFCACHEESHTVLLSGLPCLTSLKEFVLSRSTYDDDFMEDLRAQLARNPNRPIFKRTS